MTRKKVEVPRWRFYMCRRYATAAGPWPFTWGWFTNWWGFSVNLGEPKEITKGRMKVSRIVFSCSVKPLHAIAWWYGRRIFWIGDWKWKKDLWWKKDL